MRQHSKRDLRAADILALILTGIGVLFLVLGVWTLVDEFHDLQPPPPLKGKAAPAWASPGLRATLLGGIFVCLGMALNVKVRRIVSRGGREDGDEVAPG